MPRLLLVRHAEAVAGAGEGDRERPLSAQGRADAANMGSYFRASGLAPDLALASPARRARDTLDAILRELPRKLAACGIEASLYNASAGALRDLLARTSGPVKTLLIVGHNPGVGEFARFLVNRKSALPRHFPAPCLVVINFSCGNWSEASAGDGTLDRFVDFSRPAADGRGSRKNENG